MSATPKWYCRSKTPTNMFSDVHKVGVLLRIMTKRVLIDMKNDMFNEHNSIIKDCEKLIEQYWILKNGTKEAEVEALKKKIKRDPYNILLVKKYELLMETTDRHFCQLTFVLKKAATDLLRKANESEVRMSWALQMVQLYNKCQRKKSSAPSEEPDKATEKGAEKASEKPSKKAPKTEQMDDNNEFNPNICSNMYPELLLPFKPIDFSYVLQHVSHLRVEKNSLDLIYKLLNIDQQNPWQGNGESNCSSMEILRILTLNLAGDTEFTQQHSATTVPTTPVSQRNNTSGTPRNNDDESNQAIRTMATYYGVGAAQNDDLNRRLRIECAEQSIQKEKDFIAQLIEKSNAICPTVFGSKNVDLDAWAARGMRQIWSHIAMILDNILLWWMDTPLACYPLSHVEALRNWLLSPSISELPEPVSSTLRGVGEILTNFVCINVWDQLFRLTLISSQCTPGTIEKALERYGCAVKNDSGTPAGMAWVNVFSHLINLSNSCLAHADNQNTSLVPVAEQIPILHRIDHSVHSMRIWAKEQAKQHCSDWRMDSFFKIMEHDLKITLDLFSTLKLPKLAAELDDVLLLVYVALRTKLVFEVNTNLEKLKCTNAESVETLSAVCRVLSLANFSLCFPGAHHWQQTVYDEDDRKSAYVGYVLDQILLPTIKATKDIVILKLVLQIICESWLDYIYQKRIRFTVNGALRLLNDFDEVREWIIKCPLLDEEQMNKLSNHEVLRMCKGVGKILLRKPEDVISIAQSPKYDKRSGESPSGAQETQLPSEMFVSNQKNWLQLRASSSRFSFFKFCCDDSVL